MTSPSKLLGAGSPPTYVGDTQEGTLSESGWNVLPIELIVAIFSEFESEPNFITELLANRLISKQYDAAARVLAIQKTVLSQLTVNAAYLLLGQIYDQREKISLEIQIFEILQKSKDPLAHEMLSNWKSQLDFLPITYDWKEQLAILDYLIKIDFDDALKFMSVLDNASKKEEEIRRCHVIHTPFSECGCYNCIEQKDERGSYLIRMLLFSIFDYYGKHNLCDAINKAAMLCKVPHWESHISSVFHYYLKDLDELDRKSVHEKIFLNIAPFCLCFYGFDAKLVDTSKVKDYYDNYQNDLLEGRVRLCPTHEDDKTIVLKSYEDNVFQAISNLIKDRSITAFQKARAILNFRAEVLHSAKTICLDVNE